MQQNTIVQNAYVVDDLEQAVDNWVKNIGAGPFFVIPKLALNVIYRGRQMPLDISLAFGQSGTVQIELIKVNCVTENVYTDVYPNGTVCGFHHVALFSPDLDNAIETYEAKGYPLAMDLTFGETRVAYMDARHDMGCMVEFYQDTEELRAMYAKVAEAAENWDGSDPLRMM